MDIGWERDTTKLYPKADNPEKVIESTFNCIDSGCWYITVFRNGGVAAMDRDDVLKVTWAINGGKTASKHARIYQPDEEHSVMRILVLTACVAVSLSASQAHATTSFNYKVLDSKPIKEASIQTVSFDAIAGMDQNALKKVNAALMDASAVFDREAKQCGAAAQGHPWGYNLTFEKVIPSEKYLSVVFAKSTVCAGSPDREKEARVFSLPAGNLVSAKTLFKRVFPAAKLPTGVSMNKELINLDEEMS